MTRLPTLRIEQAGDDVIVEGYRLSNARIVRGLEGKPDSIRVKANAPWPAAPPPEPEPEPEPEPLPPSPTPGGFLLPVDPRTLGMSSSYWTAMAARAGGTWPGPALSADQDRTHSACVLAAALVGLRTGNTAMLNRAKAGIDAALPTSSSGVGNNVLSHARQLPGYVLAASAMGYRPVALEQFLRDVRSRNLGGHSRWYSLTGCASDSSNNWGALSLAALTAIDLYLGDAAGAARAAKLYRGFMGDLSSWQYPRPTIQEPSWVAPNAGTWTPIQQAPGDPRNGAPTEDAWRYDHVYPQVKETYVMDTVGALALTAELLQHSGAQPDAWARMAALLEFTRRFPTVWSTTGGRGGRAVAHLVNRRSSTAVSTANTGDQVGYATAWLAALYGG